MNPSSRLRIVWGNGGSMASYPQGGGHWMVRLQHLLGLRNLGHDVFLLELLRSTGDASAASSISSQMSFTGLTLYNGPFL